MSGRIVGVLSVGLDVVRLDELLAAADVVGRVSPEHATYRGQPVVLLRGIRRSAV
jgi:hypothetical protein